jgi:hypothetical protein
MPLRDLEREAIRANKTEHTFREAGSTRETRSRTAYNRRES